MSSFSLSASSSVNAAWTAALTAQRSLHVMLLSSVRQMSQLTLLSWSQSLAQANRLLISGMSEPLGLRQRSRVALRRDAPNRFTLLSDAPQAMAGDRRSDAMPTRAQTMQAFRDMVKNVRVIDEF